MQFKQTFSLLFASALLLTPVKALAASSPKYEIFEVTNSQMNLMKWGIGNDQTIQHKVANVYTGTASWYGPGFYGNRTANGEVYRPGTYTVAHRYLRFGTRVRVTNLNNGRSAIARVNDRGPYVGGRIVDLGHGIARDLGVISSGLATVRLEVLD
jgi:rare lipoprotein A (peptidoglycan hydrolase)